MAALRIAVIPAQLPESGTWASDPTHRDSSTLQRIEDLVRSVCLSPWQIDDVAGEYARFIKHNQFSLLLAFSGFVLARAGAGYLTKSARTRSAGLAIQLGLQVFGMAGAVGLAEGARTHFLKWFDLGLNANGNSDQIDAASREFIKMHVSLLMAIQAAKASVGSKAIAGPATTGKAPSNAGKRDLDTALIGGVHTVPPDGGATRVPWLPQTPGQRSATRVPWLPQTPAQRGATRIPWLPQTPGLGATAGPLVLSTNPLVVIVNGEAVPGFAGGSHGPSVWNNDEFVRMTPSFFESMWHLRNDWELMDRDTRLGEYRKIIAQALSEHGVRIGVDIELLNFGRDRFSRKHWKIYIPDDAMADTIDDWSEVYRWLAARIAEIVEDWNALSEALLSPTTRFVTNQFPANVVRAAQNATSGSRTIGPDRSKLLIDAIVAESRIGGIRRDLSKIYQEYYASPLETRDNLVLEKAKALQVERAKQYSDAATKGRRWEVAGQWAAEHQSVQPPPGALDIHEDFFSGMRELRDRWQRLNTGQRLQEAVKLLNQQLAKQGVPPVAATLDLNGFSLDDWSLGIHPDLLTDQVPEVGDQWEILNEVLAFHGAQVCDLWLIIRRLRQNPSSHSTSAVALDPFLSGAMKSVGQPDTELPQGERERAEMLLESMQSEESHRAITNRLDAIQALKAAENELEQAQLELAFQKTGESTPKQLAFKTFEAKHSAWENAQARFDAAHKAFAKRPEYMWAITLARRVRAGSRPQ